jgi:hypothetical protein
MQLMDRDHVFPYGSEQKLLSKSLDFLELDLVEISNENMLPVFGSEC